MAEIFTWLSRSLEGNPVIALAAAFLWGVGSIVLSPCHLASIPLIIGFIDEQGNMNVKRAFWLSLLFSLGILATIGVIGVVTAGMGRMIGDVGRVGNYFVGAVFLIVGLHLMDLLPLPFLSNAIRPGLKSKGALAVFILGLVFGIALGPCTFAYMASMLGITFKISGTRFAYGMLLLLFYGIGHSSMIIFAGTFTEIIQRYLNWNERSKGVTIVKRVCGALVLLAGIYMLIS